MPISRQFIQLAKTTGISTELGAPLHYREPGSDFGIYMHNDKKIERPTIIVPVDASQSYQKDKGI